MSTPSPVTGGRLRQYSTGCSHFTPNELWIMYPIVHRIGPCYDAFTTTYVKERVKDHDAAAHGRVVDGRLSERRSPRSGPGVYPDTPIGNRPASIAAIGCAGELTDALPQKSRFQTSPCRMGEARKRDTCVIWGVWLIASCCCCDREIAWHPGPYRPWHY